MLCDRPTRLPVVSSISDISGVVFAQPSLTARQLNMEPFAIHLSSIVYFIIWPACQTISVEAHILAYCVASKQHHVKRQYDVCSIS